jgi:hypothetical protein
MEQNPIYQGTQYTAANTATSNANVPSKLLFADEWERNRHATTQALQGIEQALIERNDNTVLLNQQAEAKRRDLEMTMEMKSILDLDNGVEGSWYDNNGKLNKQAVRDFIKKYSTMPTQWAKAARSPEAQQKSASMSQAYQIGVQEAVEAAILANTKKRELKAYQDNMQLAEQMQDYDGMSRINQEAGDMGLKSPQEVAADDIAIDGKRLATEMEEMRDVETMQSRWFDPAFQARLEYHPKLKSAFKEKIERENNTIAKAKGSYYQVDPNTGERKAVKGEVTPPDGAPFYIKSLFYTYKNEIPFNEAYKAMQKYLWHTVTETRATAKGEEQWATAKSMANTLGLDDATFTGMYKTISEELEPGGFNAAAILKNIDDAKWLNVTTKDDVYLNDIATRETPPLDYTIKAKMEEYAKDARDEIIVKYENWLAQATKSESGRNPTTLEKYNALLSFVQKADKDWAEIEKAVRANMQTYVTREGKIQKRKDQAIDDKRRNDAVSASMDKLFPTPKRWKVSSGTSFNYELAPVDPSLPDSTTSNIIYLPKDMELPAKSLNVAIENGELGFNIEFRKADVKKPTPSARLLCSMKTPTFSPDAISWNGRNLVFSNTEAEYPASLFPDDGLVPEEYYEESESEYAELPIPDNI